MELDNMVASEPSESFVVDWSLIRDDMVPPEPSEPFVVDWSLIRDDMVPPEPSGPSSLISGDDMVPPEPSEPKVQLFPHKGIIFYEYEMDVENVEQGCQQLEDASNTFGKNQETATEAYMNALKALFDIIGGGTENPPIQQFTEICEKIDALKQALEESKDKLVKYANTIN